mgnify:CR=1 FL=1
MMGLLSAFRLGTKRNYSGHAVPCLLNHELEPPKTLVLLPNQVKLAPGPNESQIFAAFQLSNRMELQFYKFEGQIMYQCPQQKFLSLFSGRAFPHYNPGTL